jgi:hypothetical protein
MNTVWTDTDQKMLQLISVKKSIEEIAKVQKRSVSTIKSRLKVLAADMYFNQKMPYEQVEARTGIKKDILLVRRQKIQISEDKEPEVKPMLEAIPEAMPLVNKVKVATVVTVAPITREIVTQTEPITDHNTQNTPLAIISTLILSTIADCLSPNR